MKIIILLLYVALCFTAAKKKWHHTPQALHLKNHYGLPSAENHYGPRFDHFEHQVENNPDTYVPFRTVGRHAIEKAIDFNPTGWERELVQKPVINSGEMTNIAPTATKLIKPQLAVPALQVKAQVEYPAVVRLPTYYGVRRDWHEVHAYDKKTGRIIKESVLIDHPEIRNEDHVKNVVREHEHFINLRNGLKIYPNDLHKAFHGIDTEKRLRR